MAEEELLPFCECGKCGLRVTKKGNRFIHGHNRRGKPHTPEHNAAISEGRRNSDVVKAHNESMRGVTRSPEVCAAISKAKTGVPQTPEARAANSKCLIGVPLSPEVCAKMSDTHTGVPLSPEYIASLENHWKKMRGGNDICDHHYIYDHAHPELYTMKVTRSKHQQIHMWMKKAGIKVPHINVADEDSSEVCEGSMICEGFMMVVRYLYY